MDSIVHTAGRISFESRLSPLHRILMALFGLLPLYAPYDLIIRRGWPDQFTLNLLFPLLICLGAIAVSLIFLSGAFLGVSQRVLVDQATGAIVHENRKLLTGNRTFRHPFPSIDEMNVRTVEGSDGPATYNIRISVQGGENMEFGEFSAQEEAEGYLSAIAAMIGRH